MSGVHIILSTSSVFLKIMKKYFRTLHKNIINNIIVDTLISYKFAEGSIKFY